MKRRRFRRGRSNAVSVLRMVCLDQKKGPSDGETFGTRACSYRNLGVVWGQALLSRLPGIREFVRDYVWFRLIFNRNRSNVQGRNGLAGGKRSW